MENYYNFYFTHLRKPSGAQLINNFSPNSLSILKRLLNFKNLHIISQIPVKTTVFHFHFTYISSNSGEPLDFLISLKLTSSLRFCKKFLLVANNNICSRVLSIGPIIDHSKLNKDDYIL